MKIPIVVASMGRCGSTLVYDVVSKTRSFKEFKIFYKDDNTKLDVDKVYKTHSLPYIYDKCKAIYLFGNPMNIVISAHLHTNIEKHYLHLGGDFNDRMNFNIRDTLHLEENFDAWYKIQRFELITLRYETLYKNIDMLEDFLQEKLTFPQEIDRRTNYLNNENKEVLEKTYGNLYRKILNSEDAKIWSHKLF